MSRISCHVLDTSTGRPATGIAVQLEWHASAGSRATASWAQLAQASTNTDGRATLLDGSRPLSVGQHRITFETEAYFLRSGRAVFYPRVQVLFVVADATEAYHIPLLLSPFGYTTYRGS